MLDFLIATVVGRQVLVGWKHPVSEVSEAELRESVERGELGAGGASRLFLPTPDFVASAGER